MKKEHSTCQESTDQLQTQAPDSSVEGDLLSIYLNTARPDGLWVKTLRRRLVRVLASKQLAPHRPAQRLSLSLCLSDAEEVRALNAQYRGKDKVTDVLSFALQEGEPLYQPEGYPVELGDIIISLPTAAEQAARGALPRLEEVAAGRPWGLSEEVAFLSLHGPLHLLGFDHVEEEEAVEMEGLEAALLPTLLGWRGRGR